MLNFRNYILNKVAAVTAKNQPELIKELLFESAIIIFCILGFLAVIIGGWEVLLRGKAEIALLYTCLYLPLCICYFLKNKISYQYRAIILLLDLFILSVILLVGVGLSGAGISLLITFSVLSTTFLGIRMGIISVLLGVLAIFLVGMGMTEGIIPVNYAAITNSTRIESWRMATIEFFFIGSIMVICPGILLKSLQRTISVVQKKTFQLQESNQSLNQALKDRQEIEAKLIRAEKMEAMGLLAGGVAHDLNNILTGVTTGPELLLLDMSPEDKLYEPMKMIKSSGDKAATIVRDLLTLSRRGVNVKEVLNFESIVKKCLQSPEYEKLLQFHSDTHIETSIQKNMTNILGSEVHLINVIMNLLSNASEAMPSGGKIRLKAQNKLLEFPMKRYENIPKGEYATLTITDEGSGITPSDLEHLFEPFFTKKKMGRSGTGLGMAIVLGSVKDHNGFIDIKTSENKGTSFTLYFPTTGEELLPEKEGFDPSKFRGKGQTILFVDDVQIQREMGGNLLNRLGYDTSISGSGEEAIKFCQTHKPELLMVDMIMDPGIDGFETLKQVRIIYPDLPAVILSGYSESDQVKDALSMGSAMFLKKPYNVEQFTMAVYSSINALV